MHPARPNFDSRNYTSAITNLQAIAAEGVCVELKKDVPLQAHPPDNHESAIERVNILSKNVRKEQDAWWCLVLDLDLHAMWPEVFVSSFGIVDKAGGDPLTSGRTIHDLLFPEGASINAVTDQDAILKADYRHCDAVASEILRIKREHPDIEIKAMAGDVTSAFRNIPFHSRSVHHFAGCIEIENALVVELACPFGWTGSPGEYEVIGEAIAFVHGSGNCSPVHLLPTNGVPGGPRVPRKDVAPSTYIFVSTILRPWPGKTALRHVTPAPKTLSGCSDTGGALSTSVSRLPILPGSTTPAQTPARALPLTVLRYRV
ncbi:unnamed protein product [Phytophthora fragariaefolia]|uniref:Unnamed protein product n=1 Tax=Phytophthora fragariaefolia TaxID=1490495 RepID=A0A9W6TJ59_9STRA|nr:unnamed protein product [Phytophthora fragariaefolia]